MVSAGQLRSLGVGEGWLRHRVEQGVLVAVHAGVYAVGHRRVSLRGRWMAGVLACGEGAVLSHRSAARLWGILGGEGTHVDVSAPGRHRVPGVRARRASALPADETTVLDGIPVTSVHRTLVDLASVLPPDRLHTALNEAAYRKLDDPVPLDALVGRHRGRRGIAVLRTILAEGVAAQTVRSPLEQRFLRLVRELGLPRPETNAHVEAGSLLVEADAVWRDRGLAVELDGRDAHERASAFRSDRRRDRALVAAGWRVIRVSHEDLVERDALARDLLALR